MGNKLTLDEKYITDEYKKGKGSTLLSRELGVSKHVILTILNKHKIIKKRDRCKSLNITKEFDRFTIMKKCPLCGIESKLTSTHPTILCRNYINSIDKKRLCRLCLSNSMKGKNNPFYGKKHTKESLNKISKSKKGQNSGNQNHMKQEKYRQMSRDIMRSNWDNGILDRKVISEQMKQTQRSGKIKSVIVSKKEKEIVIELKLLGYEIIHSYRVDSKICDIYIPKLNLIIEYNGDYWHCNPKKYDGNYYHQVKGKTAKEIWDYDKNKIDLIKLNGYNLEVIWESELKNDHTLINKIINKYDSKNRRAPESP